MGLWKSLFSQKSAEKKQDGKPVTPIDGLPFSLELVSGEEAVHRWNALQAEGREKGFAPVILGDVEDVRVLWENGDATAGSFKRVIEKAKAVDISRWLAEREAEEPEVYQYDEGDWPREPEERTGLSVITGSDGEIKPWVCIAKIPAEQPWQIPAYLRIGNWNECPAPEYHVAMARHWQEKYGAVLISANYDVLEFLVARPPEERKAAKMLAREQFIYCTDIVHQGAETMNNLAATLLKGKLWYFWWE
jgi:hypothetical protein